jgi:hypothetical protein
MCALDLRTPGDAAMSDEKHFNQLTDRIIALVEADNHG